MSRVKIQAKFKSICLPLRGMAVWKPQKGSLKYSAAGRPLMKVVSFKRASVSTADVSRQEMVRGNDTKSCHNCVANILIGSFTVVRGWI